MLLFKTTTQINVPYSLRQKPVWIAFQLYHLTLKVITGSSLALSAQHCRQLDESDVL